MNIFRELVLALLNDGMSASEFEASYIRAYNEAATNGMSIPFAADRLFYAVDAYQGDPALRGPLDIDEAALREEASQALEQWSAPWPHATTSAS
jgi:hypothetical protein